MSKLYIFAIGGTGSRVVESLTMCLASGVKINASKVIPLIIDPDLSNANLTRTTSLLKEYDQIRNQANLKGDVDSFFLTEIESIATQTPYVLALNQINNTKFSQYIDYPNLDNSNKALVDALYSTENLDLDMSVGFQGNPNIGSVTLNQFLQSQDFMAFCNDFAEGDRIMIVGSVFGGTGASGIPLLLKSLREAHNKPQLNGGASISQSVIGAITYLPYFGLSTLGDDPVSERSIDSATFVSKTKAALEYYEHSVNKQINALYYLGDPDSFSNSNYTYSTGSITQNNDAHFLELAGALAIVDFMNQPNLSTNGVTREPQNQQFFDYGLGENTNAGIEIVKFGELGGKSKEVIQAPLTQMVLFSLFLKNKIKASLDHPWAKDNQKDGMITQNFLDTEPFTSILRVADKLEKWLQQMADNQISFDPINLAPDNARLFQTLVKSHPKPNSSFFEKGSNYDRLNHILNKKSKGITGKKAQERFLPLFYAATKELVSDKYNM